MAKVVIVIPTYNEIEGTKKMIPALAKFFETVKDYDMHLLYADDTSPDGTYKVVQKYQKKYKWLHLSMSTEKVGIGGAYVKAFKYARDKLDADYIMEFDADFQHRIEDIPNFLNAIKEDPDLVIGSRYVKGGSIPSEWGVKRKFFSVVGNWICRAGFLMPKIHDFTTGFKLTKARGGLDKVPLDDLYSKDFAYKIQMTAEIANKGGKVIEVPIVFKPRTEGESKLIKNELGDFLRVIFLFQWNNPKMRKFIKFGTVGFVGYLVNAIGLVIFAKYFTLEPLIWIFATELAIISNFILNNIWTFKEDKITGVWPLIKKFIQFNVTSAGALIIQAVAGSIGVAIWGPGSRQILLPFIIVLLVLPYNYTMYNLVIWKSWRKKK
ncbi:glycosyltransferase [Patescibacteria group bacterium]